MSEPEPTDALVRPEPVSTAVDVAPPSAETDDAAPRRRSRAPWVAGGIVLGVLLLAGAGVAAFLLLTPPATPAPAVAVLDYDQAYADADCDLYFAVTTVDYRERLAPTCADFEAEARTFADAFSDYVVVVESTEIEGSAATVVTTESWVLDGQENTTSYTYTLVDDDGAWRIDALD